MGEQDNYETFSGGMEFALNQIEDVSSDLEPERRRKLYLNIRNLLDYVTKTGYFSRRNSLKIEGLFKKIKERE